MFVGLPRSSVQKFVLWFCRGSMARYPLDGSHVIIHWILNGNHQMQITRQIRTKCQHTHIETSLKIYICLVVWVVTYIFVWMENYVYKIFEMSHFYTWPLLENSTDTTLYSWVLSKTAKSKGNWKSQIRSCLIYLEKAQRSPLDKLFMHYGQHQLSIETLEKYK